MKKRVVITGMAPICSLGTNHEEMFKNLCEKKQIKELIPKDTPARKKLRTKYYVPYPVFEEERFAEQLKYVKARGSKSSYLAAAAALLALEDAKIKQTDEDTRVYVGVGAPNMAELYDQVVGFKENMKMNINAIPLSMQSSVAAWISIILGLHGKSMTISMACTSGTEAIGAGYESILEGKCKLALCGGSDYLSDPNLTLLKGFEYLKAVSNAEDGIPRNFSEERKGFLFSEGAAAILVLEELEHALERNATIYAEVTGFESSSDGFNIISMYPDGRVIKKMLEKLIKNKKIDYYNAHGTATKLNDGMEECVIKELFGGIETQPAISATKGLVGHTLGASGAIEAIVCADAICHNKVHANSCGTIIKDLNITEEARDYKVDTAISASYGFGGHNAAIMIERFYR